jgi:hypothetical protein
MGFLKQKKNFIIVKKEVYFNSKHVEWYTYLNMQDMYEEEYSILVTSGLAVKHETSYRRNEAGGIVELEQDAFGMLLGGNQTISSFIQTGLYLLMK